ncbi:hypothetical protein ElyMa_003644500 [Elysia marginata]|uniref:Uncharacterized protein n=1 Tax=Elysia marginata TaxID=1093978 RepID=A0AAV4EVQ3_9GAST|nr:hypothetical protein ElyMa_003644500 [Elysia marginata]
MPDTRRIGCKYQFQSLRFDSAGDQSTDPAAACGDPCDDDDDGGGGSGDDGDDDVDNNDGGDGDNDDDGDD